jgi:nucleoside-diphosphate-sugar epimerase
MKVLVIGGTGHVGKFMVPMLVDGGLEVIVAASGKTPVPKDRQWSKVKYVACDASQGEGLAGLKALAPDVVIEMPGNIWNVYQALKSVSKHFIACGSLWMYGEPVTVPTPEKTQNECVFEGYKKRYAEILELIETGRCEGAAFTAIMPPNICGPGKVPLECLGGRSRDVHAAHARGDEVIFPDGADVLIGPCDAEDIAQCFVKSVYNRDAAAGQIFNVGSEYALTATEFVRAYAKIYNVEISIKRVPWDEYISKVSPGIGYWWHFKAHMCPDISKAKRLLGYSPKYTPEETLGRAVEWMRREDRA